MLCVQNNKIIPVSLFRFVLAVAHIGIVCADDTDAIYNMNKSMMIMNNYISIPAL